MSYTVPASDRPIRIVMRIAPARPARRVARARIDR